LSFKELRELEGMERQIQELEAEIARIENLFATPDFHRTHAANISEWLAKLADAKAKLPQLYSRWEELEGIKGAAGRFTPPPAL
jgi:hypothetical protein